MILKAPVSVTASVTAWCGFAAAYLSALDAIARDEAAAEGKASRRSRGFGDVGYTRKRQAGNLAAWHGMLAEHLTGNDDAGLLDRLVSHR